MGHAWQAPLTAMNEELQVVQKVELEQAEQDVMAQVGEQRVLLEERLNPLMQLRQTEVAL